MDQIRADRKNNRYIQDQVRSLIDQVQEDIHNAREHMEKQSITELPQSFHIPEVPEKDAQRQIYYHVMRAFEKENFTVKIKLPCRKCTRCKKKVTRDPCPHCGALTMVPLRQKTYLVIPLETKMDDDERAGMDQYINERRIV